MKLVPSTTVNTRRLLRVLTVARPSRRTALAAFVAALVVGILGMHALATHGTTPAPAASNMAMTGGGMSAHETTTTTPGASSEGHDAAVSGVSTTAADNEGDTGSGSGHDMGTMVMLCVVMLAAAALTLLVLLVRIARPLLPAAFHPAAAPARILQWVRGTGPPHVWAFSVIRC